jgi:type I protein arginine methyltransferase
MYGILEYGNMIADEVRMRAYEQALRLAITPGCTVLDIGTGFGIHALLACRLGAGRVFAVELDDAIHLARDLAARNGYSDRIEFLHDLSTNITLPKRADVVVSDLRGVLPFFGHHIPAVADARRRHLADSGTMISARDTLWAAVVESPEWYRQYEEPWSGGSPGLDLESARIMATSSWCKARFKEDELLVAPSPWASLDYNTIEATDVRADLAWPAQRAGTAHGIVVWFDAVVAPGIEFSNAPGRPRAIYGSAFFPLAKPVPLAMGDTVQLALGAHLIGEDYVWIWNTTVHEAGNQGRIKASFRQSTLQGTPLDMGQLRKQADTHVPMLSEAWNIDRYILDSMNGSSSVGEIATDLMKRFPTRFSNWRDALARVGALSRQYSQ